MNTSYYINSYDYAYPAYDSADAAGLAGAAVLFTGAMLLVWLLAMAASYVINAIFMMMLFKKAGLDGWKAWVPVYNTIKFFQIGGQNPLYLLFVFIPFVGPLIVGIFSVIAAYHIGLKLGKSGGYAALYFFLPLIWLIILGVDKSTWKDSLGAASLAPEKSPK
jgi:hypothetical protein